MTKNAKIYVVSIQEDDNSENIAYFADAIVFENNSTVFIEYTDIQDDNKTNTKIGISGGIVSITREGSLGGTMVFERDTSYEAILTSEYGNLNLVIVTNDVSIKSTSQKIEIDLKYSIFSGTDIVSCNRVKIACEIVC